MRRDRAGLIGISARLVALAAIVSGSAAMATAGEGEAIEAQAKLLVTAVAQQSATGLRGLVDDRILLALPGPNNLHRSTPEKMIETLRGCSHHLTKRFPGDEREIFILYVCDGLPRGDIMEEEEPGYVLRLWRHSLGLAVAYAQGGVQVRPLTRALTMPAKAPPARPLPAEAGEQLAVTERFVALVKSGQDAKASEFGEIVSAADAAKLRAMAPCQAGTPRTSDGGGSVLIVWDCPGQPANKGVGTMLSFRDGKVTTILVMGAVMVTTGSR